MDQAFVKGGLPLSLDQTGRRILSHSLSPFHVLLPHLGNGTEAT